VRFSHFFIDRPVFAGVLSIVLVVVGLVAVQGLPIAQYPDIVPPTVNIRASYPGASAKTVSETVAAPIEQEINGVPGMLYMTSTATNAGSVSLDVTFELGTDIDEAQVEVQNRVGLAEAKLPDEVRRAGISIRKRSPSLAVVINLVSPDGTYDELYLRNYAVLQVKDELARVKGAGDVQAFGGEYSLRVWLDPRKVAARGLTATDVAAAIREQNIQVAAGRLGQAPAPPSTSTEYIIKAQGRLIEEGEFGNIVISTGADGQVVRLKDVARIELGSSEYGISATVDGMPSAVMAVSLAPGANAIETQRLVIAKLDELKQRFPPGLDYNIVYDTTPFVAESVNEVLKTLYEALALVLIVVIVFLQSWRATVIPLLAIPVSLIGTFAVMSAMGFSLNTLSLFGLVLAIGIVVDDAIVVVENMERYLQQGMSAKEAARKTMDEVGSALVAIAVVLSAVFIPTAFISGMSGEFYRQFGLTIAVATIISAFNSLTLSPALGAIFLKPHGAPKDGFQRLIDRLFGRFFALFNRGFEASSRGYGRLTHRLIRLSVLVLVVYGFLIGLTWLGFTTVPSGFVPSQDKGYLIAVTQLPDGASLGRTQAVADRVEQVVRETPGVAHYQSIRGLSIFSVSAASNAAVTFIVLKPFEERTTPELSSSAITAALAQKLSSIEEAYIGVFPPPPVDGLGNVGGLKMQVQDRNAAGALALQEATGAIIGDIFQTPGFVAGFSSFRANVPFINVDVDRTKAKAQDVPVSNVFDTLQVYMGSLYVNDFTRFGRNYKVTLQADAQFRLEPEQIGHLYTRNGSNALVPLGALTTVAPGGDADTVVRFNMYTAADVNAVLAPGMSTGDGVRQLQALVEKNLPAGMTFEWTELTLQQVLEGDSVLYIFPLCVLFIFLALAALYESWSLPLAILLIVPMCLLAAISGVWVSDGDNNILTQIGFIVLVGLAAKNAILIVEFAKQQQDQGVDRVQAAVEAARLRLRPIIMTSAAFILGVLPLVIASGAGAELRQSLGIAVFSGMFGVTVFGLLMTPVFYVVIRWFVERKAPPPVPASAAAQPRSGAS
jgi:multidrug efflux pump